MITSLKVLVDCKVVLSPVVLALLAAIQVKVEPATLVVKAIVTVFPVQIVAEPALVIVGVGLTVTVTVCAVPEQVPAVDVGVTV